MDFIALLDGGIAPLPLIPPLDGGISRNAAEIGMEEDAWPEVRVDDSVGHSAALLEWRYGWRDVPAPSRTVTERDLTSSRRVKGFE